MMFGFQKIINEYPLKHSLLFSIVLLSLSSCSNGKERAEDEAIDQSLEIPVENNSAETPNQHDSFLWNGEFKVNGIAPPKILDTDSFESQLFDFYRNSCRVFIILRKEDIDETVIYQNAIDRAEACPLCRLDSVYDIHVQGRKGIGTQSLFTDTRQPGEWSMTNNIIWFKKSETTFNKFARIQFNCWVGSMEFVNINSLD